MESSNMYMQHISSLICIFFCFFYLHLVAFIIYILNTFSYIYTQMLHFCDIEGFFTFRFQLLIDGILDFFYIGLVSYNHTELGWVLKAIFFVVFVFHCVDSLELSSQSCHLWIRAVLYFLFQCICFLFIFLSYCTS